MLSCFFFSLVVIDIWTSRAKSPRGGESEKNIEKEQHIAA